MEKFQNIIKKGGPVNHLAVIKNQKNNYNEVITMISKRILLCLLLILVLLPTFTQAAPLPSQSEIIAKMRLVNDYWINGHSDPGDCGWARAAYFSGNMACYYTTSDSKYYNYALTWANKNNWQTYGYTGTYTTNADAECCGQTYIELYNLAPDPNKISNIKATMDNMCNQTNVDYWWWIDAFYMAAPVFSKLGNLYSDTKYFNKMYACYDDAKTRRGLYDSVAGLWYRDGAFVYPTFKTPNGLKCFWARGNGWVFGSMVRILQSLPANDPHRNEYISRLQTMAAALKNVQRSDGFWNVSLFDPNDYPGPETSGTSFFTYGLAWGINNGFLDRATYLPVATNAWNGLVATAVHSDGMLGYVQGVGSQPNSSQPVTYNTTADFGVGAFLLAGSELAKIDGPLPTPGPTASPTPGGPNLALNKPVSFSSQQTGNEATHAVDGDISTRWSADTYPEWIQVDLGSIYNINKTELVPYLDRAYRYKIEISTDNTNFIQVVDRTANTVGGSLLTDTFTAQSARFVKLTVTGVYNDATTWSSINEFRVFASGAATPTPTSAATPTPTPTPTPATTPTPTPTSPANWTGSDIGTVNAAGSFSEASGSYTVSGSGADVWGTSDECYFVRKQLTGNFTIIARVASTTYDSTYSQFGLMARNTLDGNSAQVSVCWALNDSIKRVKSLARTSTGGTISVSTKVDAPAPPVYLKITRSGSTFTAYKSDNGTTYTQVSQYTITMNSAIYVGMYVCSRNDGVLSHATFDNVSTQ
jgi:rhamnogalacturonyl hydrolase YesR/regulation of enolase protein 1 (concanavalin A-like superfamily)